MVESAFAFDEVMITKVTISSLTISAGIVIMLTISVIAIPDKSNEKSRLQAAFCYQ